MWNRVEFCRRLIAGRQRMGTIKRLFRQRFCDAGHRAIHRYLARTREESFAEIAQGKQVLRAESLAFYEHVIADP